MASRWHATLRHPPPARLCRSVHRMRHRHPRSRHRNRQCRRSERQRTRTAEVRRDESPGSWPRAFTEDPCPPRLDAGWDSRSSRARMRRCNSCRSRPGRPRSRSRACAHRSGSVRPRSAGHLRPPASSAAGRRRTAAEPGAPQSAGNRPRQASVGNATYPPRTPDVLERPTGTYVPLVVVPRTTACRGAWAGAAVRRPGAASA